MRNRYSKEKKIELVNLHNNGLSVNEICNIYDVSKSELYNWINEYSNISKHEDTKREVTMQEHYTLLKRLDYLERQNTILKNSKCTTLSPLDEKVEEILRLKDKYDYSIRALCEVFSVNRSTINYHLSKPNKITVTQDELYSELIKEIFKESNGVFGAKKIRVLLREKGYRIGERRIQRIMDEQNLKCNRKTPQRKYPSEEHRQYYKNKLNRKFKQLMSNKAWVSDITYFKVNNIKCYICVVLIYFLEK